MNLTIIWSQKHLKKIIKQLQYLRSCMSLAFIDFPLIKCEFQAYKLAQQVKMSIAMPKKPD